ncbi:MAG: tol-pal system protein YbgF [Methyloceanibacter sp.]
MAGLLLASLPALPCFAQEPQAESAPQPQAKAQGGDSVGARLGRLEEKVQALQVSIGTLNSFLRTKPGTDEVAAWLEGQDAERPGTDNEPQNLMAALPGGDAQSLYQQGYGALLQKDYAGAEGAFRQLLDSHPKDPLAGDAQYWIGETYYVRGQYKNAADAFLKGYKKYKSGQKAPDSLLKLGMALAALGQKDAACSTFDELKAKYPGAPDHIADEAKAERKKAGC